MGLLVELYHAGVRGINWSLIDSLYTDCKEVVRWQGSYSDAYEVHQGVRQGGVLSTSLYKEYINPLLIDCERSRIGITIGSIYLGIPTCAEDVLLLSNSDTELQAMLDEAYTYSKENQYRLHPGKSTVTQLIGNYTRSHQLQLTLGDEDITTTDTFLHLGMNWSQGNLCPTVEEKISAGRRTAYMLIGVGIHGSDGLNPVISSQVMKAQVLPRMTHGLEATVTREKDLTMLNKAYKDLLRQHQSLPDRVGTESIYLLTGTFPASAYIEYKTLLLFGAICRLDEDNPLFELSRRQLSLPDNSHSWFVHVRQLAAKYEVDLLSAREYPWSAVSWKRYIKEAVFGWHYVKLIQGATQKKSLMWLDLNLCKKGAAHPLWKTSIYNIEETRKAAIRVKFLTGTYILQDSLLKFGKCKTSTCLLCEDENEDVIHFLTRCSALRETRETWTPQISNLLAQANLSTQISTEWVKMVLNGGNGGVLNHDESWCMDFNYLCNRLIYNLHKTRDLKLNKILLLQ
jgi:hypothetical protein